MKKLFFTMFFCILSLIVINSQSMDIRSVDTILSEIRKEQGLKGNEKINPDKVSEQKLEELGDSLMEIMIGNHEEHERMDNMMGGDGSKSLNAMHSSIAYRYLSGIPVGMMGGMMGYNGMMNGFPLNNNLNYKGGTSMMSNDYGMMGWGFGNWVMIFIIIVFIFILIAIGVLIFYAIKKNQNTNFSSSETPLDILKKRYAKGEISKEDFNKIKNDL